MSDYSMNPKDSIPSFIEQMYPHLLEAWISLDTEIIDHLCRRSATYQDFETHQETFMKMSDYYNETFFREKTFFVFFLKEPIIIWSQKIYLIEYPAPSTKTAYPTWWQHIELLSVKPIQHIIHPSAKKHVIHKSYVNWDTEEYLLWDDLTAIKVLHTPLIQKIMNEWWIFQKVN